MTSHKCLCACLHALLRVQTMNIYIYIDSIIYRYMTDTQQRTSTAPSPAMLQVREAQSCNTSCRRLCASPPATKATRAASTGSCALQIGRTVGFPSAALHACKAARTVRQQTTATSNDTVRLHINFNVSGAAKRKNTPATTKVEHGNGGFHSPFTGAHLPVPS